MTTKNIKASPGVGEYGSLSAFMAAVPADLTSSTETWEADCYDFASNDNVGITGTTTSAAFYIRFFSSTAATDGRSRDVSGTGFQIHDTTGTGVIRVAEDFVRIEDIDVKATSTATTAINFNAALGSGATALIKRCILHDSIASAGVAYTVFASRANLNLTIESTVIYGNSRPIDARSATTCAVKQTTFYGGSALGPLFDASCTIDNCYSGGHTSEDWWTGGTAPAGDYNGSEDTTATTDYTNGVNSLTASNQFNNASIGTSADFRQKSGAGIFHAGGTGIGVTNDVSGQLFATPNPSIGASEFIAAGGGRIMSSLAGAGGLAYKGGIAGAGGGLAG